MEEKVKKDTRAIGPETTPVRVAAWLEGLSPLHRRQVSEPEKELRFTRSGQAGHFAVLALLGLAAMVVLAFLTIMEWDPDGSPLLSPRLLIFLPLPFVLAAVWAMLWCVSHAYVILSPAGIEVFPLLMPQRGFRLVPWSQVRHVRVQLGNLLVDLYEGGGLVLSLSPLRTGQRVLLVEAVAGRLAQIQPEERQG